eukprot:scpid60127/ scgid2454/ 
MGSTPSQEQAHLYPDPAARVRVTRGAAKQQFLAALTLPAVQRPPQRLQQLEIHDSSNSGNFARQIGGKSSTPKESFSTIGIGAGAATDPDDQPSDFTGKN